MIIVFQVKYKMQHLDFGSVNIGLNFVLIRFLHSVNDGNRVINIQTRIGLFSLEKEKRRKIDRYLSSLVLCYRNIIEIWICTHQDNNIPS